MPELFKINPKSLPQEVIYLLKKLNEAGFSAYLVGGSVRDLLLAKQVNDYDVCTNAKPEEVKQVFSELPVLDTGLEHGTVTVVFPHNFSASSSKNANSATTRNFEITTYRSDGSYLDHRHPEEIKYSRTFYQDSMRRDFTVNQLAYNAFAEPPLLDYHGGLKDLSTKTIRTVGNPEKRFKEDALRIIRCYRFAAQLGFAIEAETLNTAKQKINDLNFVSSERLSNELKKLIEAEHLDVIWSELKPLWTYLFDSDRVAETIIAIPARTILALEKDFCVRFTVILTQVSSESWGNSLKKLTLSKKENNFIQNYTCGLKTIVSSRANELTTSSLLSLLNQKQLDLELVATMLKAINGITVAPKLADAYGKFQEVYQIIKQENLPRSINELKIQGKDLLNLGFIEGQELGETLNQLWRKVISQEIPNEYSVLAEEAKIYKPRA